jgi:S-(hydroxymethyl)glutathione dehydrogenase/alcohol dehydrogenase
MKIEKTKAAILFSTNQPLIVKEISIPEIKVGQVLVKIHYSGVCRSQLMEARGLRGEDKWLPHLLGHEASGEVIMVGENVSKVKVGDKVILGWIVGSGINCSGAKYICDEVEINSGSVTTFSSYSIVSENRVYKLPDNVPMDVAVLFGCALLTGAGMVFNELKPNSNMSVIVVGLGGIGLSAVMALSYFKCKNIIAIDISDEKLKMAKEFGATHVINSNVRNVKSDVFGILGDLADACIESGGKVETIEMGFSLIKKKTGKLYFASHPPEGENISIAPHDLIAGKKIFGSWGGGCNPDIDIPKLAEIYTNGQLPLNKLISKRYKLEDINEALNDLENGKVFRPIIEMH